MPVDGPVETPEEIKRNLKEGYYTSINEEKLSNDDDAVDVTHIHNDSGAALALLHDVLLFNENVREALIVKQECVVQHDVDELNDDDVEDKTTNDDDDDDETKQSSESSTIKDNSIANNSTKSAIIRYDFSDF